MDLYPSNTISIDFADEEYSIDIFFFFIRTCDKNNHHLFIFLLSVR